MTAMERLTRELGRLPGVGARTARRLTYHLVRQSRSDVRRLARALDDVVEQVRPCARCGSYCEAEACAVCEDPSRDRDVICVVEDAAEVGAIESAGRFRGLFHVLGGRLSPLDGIGPDELRMTELVDRIRAGQEGTREVILATSASVEGEATAVYIEGLLGELPARVTRLARGIPMGSDLEYVDGTTLAEAFAGRREVQAPGGGAESRGARP